MQVKNRERAEGIASALSSALKRIPPPEPRKKIQHTDEKGNQKDAANDRGGGRRQLRRYGKEQLVDHRIHDRINQQMDQTEGTDPYDDEDNDDQPVFS